MEPGRIELAGLLIKSGALPLSYSPVTKDAEIMPQCGLASNQANGLATMGAGVVEPVRLGSRWLISTTPIRYTMGHGQAIEAVALAKRRGCQDL